MKIYISYFYQVRFLPQNALALSTAKWDPKWFHDWKDQEHIFIDKRGVINGLRLSLLTCPDDVVEQLTNEGQMCHTNCEIEVPCEFMTLYRKYLDTIDFEWLISKFDELAKNLNVEDPFIVLLVHEPPTRKCAERPVLQAWFKQHGIELNEWSKNIEV